MPASPAKRGLPVLDPERRSVRSLVDRARQGSEEAFCELVRLYEARVRTTLGRFVRDPNVVDDLAQNTFLSGFRKLESFRGDAPLGAWLLAIAKNEALMHLRDERLRRERESAPRERTPDGGTATASHETELAALEECLAGLHEHGARLIREFYFEGRTAREISEAIGKKEVSVWVTIMRIRRALRACIQARMTSVQAGSASTDSP